MRRCIRLAILFWKDYRVNIIIQDSEKCHSFYEYSAGFSRQKIKSVV